MAGSYLLRVPTRLTAMLVALLIISLPVDADEPAATILIGVPAFFDVADDHPFATDIEWMWGQGFARGCNPPASDRFCPDADVTRGQMAAFLVRVLGLSSSISSPFVDDDRSVFETDITHLAHTGITAGCNPPANDRYCPDRNITRGEMAVFIVRGFGLDVTRSTDRFIDDDASPFEQAIERLAAAGITAGCNPPSNDQYCPDRNITRGEMAVFLRRASTAGDPRRDVTIDRSLAPFDEGWRIDASVCSSARGDVALAVHRILSGQDAQALDGVVAHPSRFEVSSGTYQSPLDVWDVVLDPGSCATLEAVWNPGVSRPQWPVDVPVVVSPFGLRRHPILGTTRLHAGVDLRGAPGSPVRASEAGTVTRARSLSGYGNVVDVVSPGGMLTRYAHLSRIEVTEGAAVEAGDLLGNVGCTGLCTGPHLHFEIRHFDTPIDPLPRVSGPPPIIDPIGVPLD